MADLLARGIVHRDSGDSVLGLWLGGSGIAKDTPVSMQLIGLLLALRIISLPYAVSEMAIAQGVNPALATCVIQAESQYDVMHRGDLDERGLFQVLPSTAIWAATKLGWQDFELSDLDDPVKNIEMGLFILANWPAWYSTIDLCD